MMRCKQKTKQKQKTKRIKLIIKNKRNMNNKIQSFNSNRSQSWIFTATTTMETTPVVTVLLTNVSA